MLALALALSLVLGLCACGGSDSAAPKEKDAAAPPPAAGSAQPSPEEQNSASAPEKDPNDITGWILEEDPESMTGTVRFWIPFKGTQGMDALIAEFNEIYPNITVELTSYSNNADGNMGVNAAILAEEVDVLASFGLENTYRRWENNMYMDLTDKLAEEGIDMAANWGTDAYNYNGTYYTLPCGGLSNYVAINMSRWNAAGLGELPEEWTWDEYLEACRKMTEVGADGEAAVFGGSLNHNIADYLLSHYQVTGTDKLYNAETGMASFNDPISVNSLQREYNAEMVEKIWFPILKYRTDGTNIPDMYRSGKIASTVTDNLSRFLNDTENYPVDWITGCAPYPVEEKGQTNYCSGVGHFSHAGIVSTAQDVDAAWAFCKYYATYGSKWLIAAGHAPTWKGTEPSSVVEVAFGSKERAATLVDVESFSRCFANSANPGYVDTQVVAATDLTDIVNEYVLAIMRGEYTVEEGCQIMQEKGDAAIKAAS